MQEPYILLEVLNHTTYDLLG